MITDRQLFWLTWLISFLGLTILIFIDTKQRKHRIPLTMISLFLAGIPAFFITYGAPQFTLNLYELELVQQMMNPTYQRGFFILVGVVFLVLLPALVTAKEE